MSNHVRDTKAGQSISAWVVTDKRGLELATVQAYYAPSGGVQVTVYDRKHGKPQQGRATGYGYDKLTAALSHLTINGLELVNHCEVGAKFPKGLDHFPRDYKRKGYRTANWSSEKGGWMSCYRISGLELLEAYGMRVHQAI